MKFIVWSKNNCGFCVNVKKFLESQGYEYEERNIEGGQWTKEDLLKAAPEAKTLPQVFFGDELVGGYDKTKEKVRNLKT